MELYKFMSSYVVIFLQLLCLLDRFIFLCASNNSEQSVHKASVIDGVPGGLDIDNLTKTLFPRLEPITSGLQLRNLAIFEMVENSD